MGLGKNGPKWEWAWVRIGLNNLLVDALSPVHHIGLYQAQLSKNGSE